MGANNHKGELEVELGERKLLWRLNWRAIAEVENALAQLEGKRVSWTQFYQRYADWTIHDWGLLLWAGLHAVDKSITHDQLMEEADERTLNYFMVLFNERQAESIPERFRKKAEQALAESQSQT